MSIAEAPKTDAAPTNADPYFQKLFADRIGGANYGKDTEIYKFEKIKRAKRKALADHPERQLLDFGIGENDDMAAANVREGDLEARRARSRIAAMRTTASPSYKEAAARVHAAAVRRDTLDPVTQICHCIGSKPAYAMLPACFINPGDVTLMTVPGYPVAGTSRPAITAAKWFKLPLLAENGFLPDLDAVPDGHLSPHETAGAELSELAYRSNGDARVLCQGGRSSPKKKSLWWFRMPRTSCSVV
jgi:LL-diaminopimelate aminotransferase